MTTSVAFAWVPSGDYDDARARWPSFGGEWHGTSHRAYCRFVENRVRDLRLTGAAIDGISPIEVEDHEVFCRTRDLDPDSADGRAQHAAEIARLGHATPWPPGRNDPCWCGSEMKYKRCCATAPPDHLSVTAHDLAGGRGD